MAVQVHSPRGICTPGPAKVGRVPAGPVREGPAPAGPAPAGAALKAHGLAVWVTPGGEDIDDAVLARAAELLLARALKIAPEAEVHVWPAAGAANSATAAAPPGGPQGHAGSRTQVPSSSVPEDSPEDDDGATPLPPSAGPASLVSVDLAAGEVRLDGQPVALTGVEFKLLRYLVENCSRAISREELRLFLESFDSPAAASRSIDVYVGRVRRKLLRGRHAIATVRGGGYQFVPGPHTKVRGPAEYCI
ncbi:winged helix-turn-helix domain-containing protein [Arthrobacter sp. ISL-72]|uniref:winged helix-turn-helix domain-containing protein n=1 Tax=Arthrobacter sp. ISL-72 TaxID=2819114 RepID=UPI001BEB03B6|nr:winged helix-turn-helix domain-containing protein [Arthrobacter sp. ISL-72]MBT2593791.1 winged helix-turn-helix transcriptional regulator [Arthrobacter sp. ISL-72]